MFSLLKLWIGSITICFSASLLERTGLCNSIYNHRRTVVGSGSAAFKNEEVLSVASKLCPHICLNNVDRNVLGGFVYCYLFSVCKANYSVKCDQIVEPYSYSKRTAIYQKCLTR